VEEMCRVIEFLDGRQIGGAVDCPTPSSSTLLYSVDWQICCEASGLTPVSCGKLLSSGYLIFSFLVLQPAGLLPMFPSDAM